MISHALSSSHTGRPVSRHRSFTRSHHCFIMASPDILVVDDTPENITVLRELLVRQGYRVRPALRGSLALNAALSHPPDLVLLDIMMPEMSGFEVCRALKTNPATAEIPVLFISALDRTSDKLKGFEAGAVDYIEKPFKEAEVLARVETHLKLRAAHLQLEKQNRELKHAAQLREDVERILRHDLKAPLSHVINFSRLLEEQIELNPVARDYLQVINDAGYRMLAMVHASFDLMRMERGDYPFTPVPVNLQETLAQVTREHKPAADRKHLAIEVVVSGDASDASGRPIYVRGEPLLTHSLFSNLLKNAIEASPEDEVITITIEPGSPHRVTMRNAGEVPPQIRDRFFHKYVTAGKESGTGLGTYSARLMARTQGGQLELDTSEPGFTRLRARLAPAPAPSTPHDKSHPSDSPRSMPKLGRVLIIDDERANFDALRHILEPFASSVLYAGGGREGIATFAAERPEIVVADLEMPDLDGFSVVSALREWEQANLPADGTPARCFAFSAHDPNLLSGRLDSSGFDGFLPKVLDAASTLGVLGQVMSKNSPGDTELQRHQSATVYVDPELAGLIPSFMDGRKEDLRQAEILIASGSFDDLRQLVHRIKGSFGLYGFAALAECCSELQDAAQNRDIAAANSALQQCLQSIQQTTIAYQPQP